MNLRNTAVIMGLALPPAAQEHGRSIQAIRTEIKQGQNVQRVEKIEPDKISETQLAELGEAVMDVRFPNERQHTYMDEMMGGEGSRGFDRGGPIMSAALVFGSWSRCSRPPWWHCPWWWQPVVVATRGRRRGRGCRTSLKSGRQFGFTVNASPGCCTGGSGSVLLHAAAVQPLIPEGLFVCLGHSIEEPPKAAAARLRRGDLIP